MNTRNPLTVSAIWLVAASFITMPAIADDGDQTDTGKSDETMQIPADSGRNSIFDRISVTGGISNDSTYSDFTVGLEYERLLTEAIGIGAAVEYTPGDMDSLVVAVPVTYRVNKWKFQVAPGFADSYRGRDFVTRLSTGYEFEVSDWIISPNAKLDFIDEKEVVILGVMIGTEF